MWVWDIENNTKYFTNFFLINQLTMPMNIFNLNILIIFSIFRTNFMKTIGIIIIMFSNAIFLLPDPDLTKSLLF